MPFLSACSVDVILTDIANDFQICVNASWLWGISQGICANQKRRMNIENMYHTAILRRGDGKWKIRAQEGKHWGIYAMHRPCQRWTFSSKYIGWVNINKRIFFVNKGRHLVRACVYKYFFFAIFFYTNSIRIIFCLSWSVNTNERNFVAFLVLVGTSIE